VRATNIALAAERISRRFAEEEQRRPSQRLADRLAPARSTADVGHRVDVAKSEHEEAVPIPPVPDPPVPDPSVPNPSVPIPPVPDPPVPSAFAARRQVSWSPVSASGQSAGVEQYRRLAAALIHAHVEHGIKVVMITSSVCGEGKSLTAANLAVTLARSYTRSTLLIDADQRDPSQHTIFNVENSGGLSDYLRGRRGTQTTTVQLLPGLTLLPAGPATSDPMGGLTSERMKQLISDAATSFDCVIVDTPPATLVPDASILAPIVDATVLVIAAGSTPYDAVERAVAAVGRERILGAVLNRADDASLGAYGYGYGYPST
jgi:capsular exopolysaccharide synthesis family protein